MRLLLSSLLFVSPLIPSFSQVSVSPYVATAAELDIEEGGVLYSFKYSGEGDDPAWVVIPDEFGIVEISHFGVHRKRNSSETTLKRVTLPQVDEHGRRLVWNAYLNGVLEKADVKTIGGYMRTGFQRAALYEYVASYPPSDPTRSPSATQSSVSRAQLYDLSGRKMRPATTNMRLPVKRAKSASVLLH